MLDRGELQAYASLGTALLGLLGALWRLWSKRSDRNPANCGEN
jgi:hypothetical protein